MKHAYDVSNFKVFNELSESALFRCKYRRLEVPYITDIKIETSSYPSPNIENEYEMLPQDINETHLKNALQ